MTLDSNRTKSWSKFLGTFSGPSDLDILEAYDRPGNEVTTMKNMKLLIWVLFLGGAVGFGEISALADSLTTTSECND